MPEADELPILAYKGREALFLLLSWKKSPVFKLLEVWERSHGSERALSSPTWSSTGHHSPRAPRSQWAIKIKRTDSPLQAEGFTGDLGEVVRPLLFPWPHVCTSPGPHPHLTSTWGLGQRLSYETFKTFAFASSLQGEREELSLAKVRATKLESSLCQVPYSLASAQWLVWCLPPATCIQEKKNNNKNPGSGTWRPGLGQLSLLVCCMSSGNWHHLSDLQLPHCKERSSVQVSLL